MTINIHQPFVYTRKRWSVTHEWDHDPNLFAVQAIDSVSPNLPTARFLWRYGRTSIAGAAKATIPPVDLVGRYVQIRRPITAAERLADPQAKPVPIWTGRITIEGDLPGSVDQNDISALPATGEQSYTARGLAADLHRCRIYGSVVKIGGAATRIDSVFNFNVSGRRGGSPAGNRTGAKFTNAASGISSYIFADSKAGASTWRASDIVEYLLAWFAPAAMSWTPDGQTTVLDTFTRVVSPGRSVAATIDQLVDRRDATAWSVVVGADNLPTVTIHSLLTEAITVGGVTVPANASPAAFDPDIEAVEGILVTKSLEHRYDRIIARGEREVVCGTFTVGVGGVIGWTAAAQTAYLAAKDAERDADKYRHVFTTYSLLSPAGGTGLFYDGNGARNGTCPSVSDNGKLDESKPAPIFLSEKTLLRQLPLLTGYTYSGGSVVLSDASDPHEFLPPIVLVKHKVAGEDAYGFVDKPSSLDNRRYDAGMSLSMLDDSPGFRIKAKKPHILALDSFAGAAASKDQPKYDYRQIVATVAIASDVRLQIIKNVGSVNAAAEIDESLTLVIDVPGAEAWYICQGTVVDCIDGKLIRTPTGIVARNDYKDLQAIADLAAAWYKRDRRALKISFKTPYYGFEPGDMITTIDPEGRVTEVNSVVTRIRWHFLRGTTTVDTDFSELDFAGFGRRVAAGRLSASRRPLTHNGGAVNTPVRVGAPGRADDPGFFGRIDGSIYDAINDNNQWLYTFTEVEKTIVDYGAANFTPVDGGRTGDAMNLIENINTGNDAHTEGNGVDPANLDPAVTGADTFAIMPCTIGNVVWIRPVVVGEVTEYWFEYTNGVDGGCT